MDWSGYLSDVNWLAVVLATLSSFVVGFVWYDKRVFGTKWMKLVGLTEKQMNNTEGMGQTFLMTAVAGLLGNTVMNMLMVASQTVGFIEGGIFGAVLGFTIRGSAHVIHNGFAKRSSDLTSIDLLHDTVAMALAGAIVGALI